MNSRVDEALLRQAIAEQILPATACVTPARSLPWPIGVLTMVGGWLATVPIVAWLFLVVPGMLEQNMLSLGIGIGATLILAGMWLINHCRDRPVLILAAVPLFFCGQLVLGTVLFLRQGEQIALALMALLALGCAWGCANHALRLVLGVQVAVLVLLLFSSVSMYSNVYSRWAILHLQLAAWCGLHAFRRSVLGTAQAELAESLGAGWIGAVVVGMALASQPFWLFQSDMSGGLNGLLFGTRSAQAGAPGESLISFLLAAAALYWLRAKWRSMRSVPAIMASCVMVVLAGFVPTLGGLLVILALSAGSARWRTAALAALACVATLVSFYQGWEWTLGMKAMLLGALGVTLLAAVFIELRQRALPVPALPIEPRVWHRPLLLPLTSVVLMLASVNWQIWQQEDLLARGRIVYFDIGPVDPRSLMQGDYMTLGFPVLAAVGADCQHETACEVVVKLDQRSVVIGARRAGQQPLAADELAIRLTVLHGRLAPGSSDWFFAEGEAERWSRARYAQFRILPDGRSALSQLRGAQLEKL